MKNADSYNHLRDEKSPYLKQHAGNPVDWYPWGERAFKLSRSMDKPIFLSIGYSTCHWCHVMERESFQDREVADLMNQVFVCIKVDREERPDVDSFYMHFCQATTGSGGWPLNVILTPNLEPIFAMTYMPRRSRRGMMGIMEMAESVRELWQTSRIELTERASETMKRLRESISAGNSSVPADIEKLAYQQFRSSFDGENGGFGSAPKFPTPHNLIFLLNYYMKTGDENALKMVRKTLFSMRMGGIWDHVGGGFHRYSTDAEWVIPHFEKMLYDQALLLWAYSSMYSVEKNPLYLKTCEDIVAFLDSEMRDKTGGYYSALDADSEGVEGKYYLWTHREIENALPDSHEFMETYCVREGGNYHGDGSVGNTGLNILHVDPSLCNDIDDLLSIVQKYEPFLGKLRELRERRVRPHTDTKILADLNALLALSFMRSGALLDQPYLVKKGCDLVDFILRNMVKESNVCHSYIESSLSSHGFLDDYSFLINALLTSFMCTGEKRYLDRAVELNEYLIGHFMDPSGFLFFSDESDRDVPMRMRPDADGAIPSGSSFEIINLAMLAEFTSEQRYLELADNIEKSNGRSITEMPMYHSLAIIAHGFKEKHYTVRYSMDVHDPMRVFCGLSKYLSVADILPVSEKIEYGMEDMDMLKTSAALKRGEFQICSGNQCLMPVASMDGLKSSLAAEISLRVP